MRGVAAAFVGSWGRWAGVLLTVALLAAAACGGEDEVAAPADEPVDDAADTAEEEPTDDIEEAGDPAEAEDAAPGAGLTAASSVFPLAWLGQQVAPGAEVTFLGAGGADPHDLELSPGDRALLETADVVLYMGALSFQPQVERAVEDSGGEVVDVKALAGEDAFLHWDEGHEHADDDGDHSHDDDHGDHEHGEYDPHLWFDAGVMADVVLEVGEAFARADAEHADRYREAAETLRDDLLAVEAELDELLTGCRLDTAIVSHAAYAYLLAPRGLVQEGISGAGGHGEASPQRIAELAEKIEREDIPAVLAEPLHGRSDAETLAREADVELLDIDPLEIGTDKHFERGYIELLREQADRFATALACEGGT